MARYVRFTVSRIPEDTLVSFLDLFSFSTQMARCGISCLIVSESIGHHSASAGVRLNSGWKGTCGYGVSTVALMTCLASLPHNTRKTHADSSHLTDLIA